MSIYETSYLMVLSPNLERNLTGFNNYIEMILGVSTNSNPDIRILGNLSGFYFT
jgi:hypothetical protein